MSPEAAGRNRRKLTVRSVYQCLTELMGKGLIRYAGALQSTGGRRPQRLQVVADARVAVGISLM